MKKGISLIVLVITIIVIIILAGAVILSLANNNPISSANEAVFKSDMSNYQSALDLYIASEYAKNDGIFNIGDVGIDNISNTGIKKKYGELFTVSNGKIAIDKESPEAKANPDYQKWFDEVLGTSIANNNEDDLLTNPNKHPDWIDISKNSPTGGISLLVYDKSVKLEFACGTSGDEYSVNWGDGQTETYYSDDYAEHTYIAGMGKQCAEGDEYTTFQVDIVPIDGVIEYVEFDSSNNKGILWCYLNTDTLTNTGFMFYEATNLRVFEQYDVNACKNVVYMNTMFSECSSLKTIPQLNTSNVKDMSAMFLYCESLTTIPLLDTRKVTDMSWMFNGCESLKTIPQLDVSMVNKMTSMFEDCTSLVSMPSLNTSKVTDMSDMFRGCELLKSVGHLDISKATNVSRMFSMCYELNSLDFSNTGLTNTQINSLFNALEEVNEEGTINISGNPGAATCNESIANNRNWTVIK